MGAYSIVSPIDGQVVETKPYLGVPQTRVLLDRAETAHQVSQQTSLRARADLCRRFLDSFEAHAESSARYVSRAMGKPLAQSRAEIKGVRSRTEALCAVAESALADTPLPELPGVRRLIRREPLGIVLDIAAWNYPYVVATNVVIPAVLAGNAVLIKHAPQTASVADHLERAFLAAGAPVGLVQALFVDHPTVSALLQDRRIRHVGFTGSVRGGRQVYQQVAAAGHASCGLEMGGKDPAIVLDDADLEGAAASLCEGAFYNAGQSCCAVERIYVPRACFARFVDAFVAATHRLVLGDPLAEGVTLGPVVHVEAARRIARQVEQARALGARLVSDDSRFPRLEASECYLPPRVLVDVDHRMSIMTEETFGPVIGIQAYDRVEQAIQLANDSDYGLTASVWTPDDERAAQVLDQLQAGTVYQNRCDAVDPDLPWVGVKDSGLGFTLSKWGIQSMTRPKSYHLKRA